MAALKTRLILFGDPKSKAAVALDINLLFPVIRPRDLDSSVGKKTVSLSTNRHVVDLRPWLNSPPLCSL